jgi:nucleotide-binding universal stress UspA family protein
MYKHIVVPLDGSKLAEVALPHAQQIGKGCGAEEVTLVRAIKHTKGYKRIADPSKVAGTPPTTQPLGGKEKKVEEYLSAIAKKLQDEGIKAQTKVLLGKPAQAIIFYSAHNPCDLIVISTHARSGLGRWLRGNVADKVLRASVVPVLMLRGPGSVPGV